MTGQCLRDRHGWAPREVEAVILPRLFLGLWLFLRWGTAWGPRAALRGRYSFARSVETGIIGREAVEAREDGLVVA